MGSEAIWNLQKNPWIFFVFWPKKSMEAMDKNPAKLHPTLGSSHLCLEGILKVYNVRTNKNEMITNQDRTRVP